MSAIINFILDTVNSINHAKVKATYTAKIRSPYPVLCSARPTGVTDFSDGQCTYHFEQPVPIPSYLMAIASGDIACARIGPRSWVYSEPSYLVACKFEFERDMESLIQTAETLIFDYPWGAYNVLVTPPSFPFGGMENPNITFATKSLIVGDHSEVGVIAHELAHSWSGNFCTNADWGDFWLNEGWTQYLERKILGRVHKDEDLRLFHHDLGWRRLQEDLRYFGLDHPYTQIAMDIRPNETPEDAYSSVQYEKGSYFLFFLEKTVGEDLFDKFIPHYFRTFSQSNVSTEQFLRCLTEFFAEEPAAKKLAKVDFNNWLRSPGNPPIPPDFRNSLSDQVSSLKERWNSTDENDLVIKFRFQDIDGWSANQIQLFLEDLADTKPAVGKVKVANICSIYRFAESVNDNILRAVFLLAIRNGHRPIFNAVADWLGQTGRSLNVRSIYRELYDVDKSFAIETFRRHENFYHPAIGDTLRKLLKIDAVKKQPLRH